MDNRRHLLHYIILFLIVGVGFWFFRVFRYQPHPQMIVVALADFGYILWGLIHHYREGRFSWSVVTEYLLLGAVVLLAFGLTLGLG